MEPFMVASMPRHAAESIPFKPLYRVIVIFSRLNNMKDGIGE